MKDGQIGKSKGPEAEVAAVEGTDNLEDQRICFQAAERKTDRLGLVNQRTLNDSAASVRNRRTHGCVQGRS